MQTMFDFARECYMHSVPPVDLNEATEKITPWDHKLQYQTFIELVEEFAKGDDERRSATYMWCLNSGPSIIGV